jgi:hypothetical protein
MQRDKQLLQCGGGRLMSPQPQRTLGQAGAGSGVPACLGHINSPSVGTRGASHFVAMTPGAPRASVGPSISCPLFRQDCPALFPGPWVIPGPRGLRWALRQGLVQGLLLYPDGSGGGLRSPLLPAKYILAELGGVHATPTGRSHAEAPLEQPLQDLSGKEEGSAVASCKSLQDGQLGTS